MSLEDTRNQSSEIFSPDERVFSPADIDMLAKQYDLPQKSEKPSVERNPTLDELRKALADQGYDLPAPQTPEEREIQRLSAQAEIAAQAKPEFSNGDYGVSAQAERITQEQVEALRRLLPKRQLNETSTAPKKGFFKRLFGL